MKPTESERTRVRRVVSQIREGKTSDWIALAAGLTVLNRGEVVHQLLTKMAAVHEVVERDGLFHRGDALPAMRWDSDRKEVAPASV
jgi:hypothetical protein